MGKTSVRRKNTRGWPAVREQLSASKVLPGSALERLVKDNQDLKMLDPEEADDQLQLPPWIRIYWRKQHPEGKYIGPGKGYPLVLERLYDWMLTHQDLPGFQVSIPTRGAKKGGKHVS